MTTIKFEDVAQRIRAAGFYAVVEMTGGMCATLYASTEADEDGRPKPVVPPPQPVLYESDDYPRYHASFGPGSFDDEGGEGESEWLSIGRDDNGSSDSVDLTANDTADSAARIIIDQLRAAVDGNSGR